MYTAIAPTRAPTSGRARNRVTSERSTLRRARPPGAAAGGGLGVVTGAVIVGSPRAVLGVLVDRGDVGGVHERRAGQRGLSTTDRVPVDLVEPEGVDREVALEEGLLVDRELDLPGLDVGRRVLVEVEGVDLGAAVRRADGLERGEGDRRAERGDLVDAGVLLELGLQGGEHRRHVRAVDVDDVGLAREAGLHTGAAVLEGHAALLLDDAQVVLGPHRVEPGAQGLAGHLLVRAEVAERARLLPEVL